MEYLALQRMVHTMATEEIRRHGLAGWTFRFNRNKSRRGVCRYRSKSIEVSVHMLPHGLKETLQVVAHELAHAIVGYQHGHDAVWRRKAMELGDDGKRCGVMHAPKTFIGRCPGCDRTVRRNRRTALIHRTCGEKILWSRA
jgi:predicted SprT family Zn-dependent metalloprotease